tara:strand:- start:530 stop:1012 length:483 start_codon:yes stop_codon:yes gene_type:complete
MNDRAGAKSAAPNCTRVTVASTVAVQDVVASKTYKNTVLTVVVEEAAAEPSQRRTRVAAPLTAAVGADAATDSLTRSPEAVTDADGVVVADGCCKRSQAAAVLADADAVDETSRTVCASDVVLDAVATIEADSRTRVDAATVALTVTTVLAAAFTAPSTP